MQILLLRIQQHCSSICMAETTDLLPSQWMFKYHIEKACRNVGHARPTILF